MIESNFIDIFYHNVKLLEHLSVNSIEFVTFFHNKLKIILSLKKNYVSILINLSFHAKYKTALK